MDAHGKTLQMKLEQGDLFELTKAAWIRGKLPSYESVWSAFIGNDGRSHPLTIPGLSEEMEEKRRLFYQAHYSFALTAYRLDLLADRATQDITASRAINTFLDQYERLFLFMGYVGHIRDMFEQMGSALHEQHLHLPFQDFYQQRCQVLHGPRLPVRFDDVSWLVPAVAGENIKPGQWHRAATWESANFEKASCVCDFITQSRERLFSLIVAEHPKVFVAADRYFEGRRIIKPVVERPLSPPDGYLAVRVDCDQQLSASGTMTCTPPPSGISPSAGYP